MASQLLVWFFLLISLNLAVANVVLISNNVSVSFPSMEANFVPAIKSSGERGVLYVAEPLHACTQLQNEVVKGSDSPFVLIVRGECSFDEKVRSAQKAGFKAAIVYNNEDSGSLVAMSGTPGGIHVHAVFVSKVSGETLTKYAGSTDTELWIMPTIQNSAWTIMAISVISILTVSSVIATCFFVRRHQIRRDRAPNRQEFHGMSRRRVKALPSLVFTAVLEDNCTSSTCAICLEDYNVGEKLRILPCRHKFHALCVDSWLTAWRTFCPVCKQDARITSGNSPPSEHTPLLTSANSTPFSSFHSSIPTSSAIQILPTPPRSRPHSLSRSSYMNSPAVSISRNSSYRRIQDSSPANSRFMSSYVPSTSNGSPSYLVGSSSHRHASLRHCGESGTSLSGMDSMYSLPEC